MEPHFTPVITGFLGPPCTKEHGELKKLSPGKEYIMVYEYIETKMGMEYGITLPGDSSRDLLIP